MSSSIFNIANWANSTQYYKHDIVLSGGYYYYALQDHTSDPSQSFAQTIAANPNLWGGMGTDPTTGSQKAQFIWKPSYQGEANITPKVKAIKFGDGYEQRVRDGINNILLEFNLSFDGRSSAEATAILHFLHEKAAYKSFLFLPSTPYNTLKKFVCRTWTHSNTFYNNNSIKVKFEEVSN
jgi:phage-related protein